MVRAGVLVSFFSSLLVLGSHPGNKRFVTLIPELAYIVAEELGVSIQGVVFQALFRVCGLIS